MSASLDRILMRAIEAGTIPSVVALAADEHGVHYAGAFGRRNLGPTPAMTVDTVVRIASMTKPITAVAAMQLVEQGHLGLDDPLDAWLPELAAMKVLDGFAADGTPRFRPAQRTITLRHLLTHTAGFAYPEWNADLLRLREFRGAPFGPLEMPLVRDAGERWEYGDSIAWAGRLVERISGESLEGYFRAHIFTPLGMGDSGFLPGPDQRARLATRHQRQENGTLTPIAEEAPRELAFFDGGGALYSTGADYLRFLRMFLGDGELDGARLLRPETIAEMGQNQIGELTVGTMRSTTPARSNDVAFFPGLGKTWGLGGLIVTDDTPDGRRAGSWSWAGLSNTYFWVDPTQRVAGLILTQILPFCDAPVLDLFSQFEHAVYASYR